MIFYELDEKRRAQLHACGEALKRVFGGKWADGYEPPPVTPELKARAEAAARDGYASIARMVEGHLYSPTSGLHYRCSYCGQWSPTETPCVMCKDK